VNVCVISKGLHHNRSQIKRNRDVLTTWNTKTPREKPTLVTASGWMTPPAGSGFRQCVCATDVCVEESVDWMSQPPVTMTLSQKPTRSMEPESKFDPYFTSYREPSLFEVQKLRTSQGRGHKIRHFLASAITFTIVYLSQK